MLPRCPQSRNPSFCCVGREPELGRRRCFEIRARAHWVAFTCDAFASDPVTCHNTRKGDRPCVWSNGTCVLGYAFSATDSPGPRCPYGHDDVVPAIDRAKTACDAGERGDGDGDDTGVWLQIRRLIRQFHCTSAYLDIGSNVGVQIHKVYQPALFTGIDPSLKKLAKYMGLLDEPTAAESEAGIVKGALFWNATSGVLPIFDAYFGPAPRCHVCSIGVEPNPRLTKKHVTLEESLRARNVGALMLSNTAADISAGQTHISPRGHTAGPNFVGGQVGWGKENVTTIDLARLVRFVHRNLLKVDGQPSRIVMKLDTEGQEYRILPHLVAQGAACLVDRMYLEWHPSPAPNGTDFQNEAREVSMHALSTPPCKTVATILDDETFMKGKAFPKSGKICPKPKPTEERSKEHTWKGTVSAASVVKSDLY